MMSLNQKELFSRVKTHLLTQNAVSMNSLGCMYRSKDGKSCALGCLISDDVYNKGLEGEGLRETNAVSDALVASGVHFDKGVLNMLCHLQHLHDRCAPDTWAAGLDTLEENLNQ